MGEGSLIQTGIDRLINLVEERGRISVPNVAKQLGVSKDVIEGWVKFLEEEDLITIEYSLTIPYLVYKKLTKRDILNKAREFKSKKESFLSKATVTLNFLEKEGENLKKSKGEFDRLKKELGYEIDKVKDELGQLEKFEKLKTELDDKLKRQRKEMEESFSRYDSKIQESQKKYQHLLGEIETEESALIDEEKDSIALEEQEKRIFDKVANIKEQIKEVEEKLKGKGDIVKEYTKHIGEMRELAENIKKDIESKKGGLEPIIEEAKSKERDIEKMQDMILDKLSSQRKDIKETKEVTDKFQKFFDRNLKVDQLLTQINKNRDELEHEMKLVIRKAQAFQITGRDKDISKNVIELEKMFSNVEKKKSVFEEQLKKLKSLFGK